MARKAGLDSALDFTKFVITMDGALIAFVTGATFLQDISDKFEKIAALVALTALVISIGSGIFVAMATATMLSGGDYELGRSHLSIPGMINVIGFGVGAFAVALLAAFELFLESPAPPPRAQPFEINCNATTAASPKQLTCRGEIGPTSH